MSTPERQPNTSDLQTLEMEINLTKQEMEAFRKLPKKEQNKQKKEKLAKLLEIQVKLDQAIQGAIQTGELDEAKKLKEQLENEMRDLEEKFDPNVLRMQELKDAMKEDAPWGSLTRFLDQINSAEEFEKITPILKEAKQDENIEYYLENLNRWKDPQLPEGFQKKFPLLASRLDTPWKVRIFLRGADFRDVDPMIMGDVFEDIIRKHEVNGEKVVTYRRYRGDKWCDALRIVYHSQLQAWTLTNLALPGHTSAGIHGDSLVIDWRTKEEREAAGDL